MPVSPRTSPPKLPESAVPDVLAPGLAAIFCGINPGRVSAAARAHFANPRNDFWRLLHAAGFTPRVLEPSQQFSLLEYGYGATNAAFRTTPGSGDLRKSDLACERGGAVGGAAALVPCVPAAAPRRRLRREGRKPVAAHMRRVRRIAGP